MDSFCKANSYAVRFAVRSSTFQYVRTSFCPENVGNWSSSSQNDLVGSFLEDVSRAVSPFSRGPVAGNHGKHFFYPAETNTITKKNLTVGQIPLKSPIGSKKTFFDPVGDCIPVGPKKYRR